MASSGSKERLAEILKGLGAEVPKVSSTFVWMLMEISSAHVVHSSLDDGYGSIPEVSPRPSSEHRIGREIRGN